MGRCADGPPREALAPVLDLLAARERRGVQLLEREPRRLLHGMRAEAARRARARREGSSDVVSGELLMVWEQWQIVRQRSERTVEYYRRILSRMAAFGLVSVSD